MKFNSGDLVKIKKTNSYTDGVHLTCLIQDDVDDYLVMSTWVCYGTYALVIRDPFDQDNEMSGEYQILIGKDFYYCDEDAIESITEE